MSKEATGSRGPVLSRPCFCLECVFVCTPSAKEGCNIPGNTLERLFEKRFTAREHILCALVEFVRDTFTLGVFKADQEQKVASFF